MNHVHPAVVPPVVHNFLTYFNVAGYVWTMPILNLLFQEIDELTFHEWSLLLRLIYAINGPPKVFNGEPTNSIKVSLKQIYIAGADCILYGCCYFFKQHVRIPLYFIRSGTIQDGDFRTNTSCNRIYNKVFDLTIIACRIYNL